MERPVLRARPRSAPLTHLAEQLLHAGLQRVQQRPVPGGAPLLQRGQPALQLGRLGAQQQAHGHGGEREQQAQRGGGGARRAGGAAAAAAARAHRAALRAAARGPARLPPASRRRRIQRRPVRAAGVGPELRSGRSPALAPPARVLNGGSGGWRLPRRLPPRWEGGMLRARPAAPHGGLRGADPTPAARPPAGTAPPGPIPAPLGVPAALHGRGAARAAPERRLPAGRPRSAPRSGAGSGAARGGGGGCGPGALQRAPPAGRAGGRPAPAPLERATGERRHPAGSFAPLPYSPSAPRSVLDMHCNSLLSQWSVSFTFVSF